MGQSRKGKFCINHADKSVLARNLCRKCYENWLCENNPIYLEKRRERCRTYRNNNLEEIKKYDRKRNKIRQEKQDFRDSRKNQWLKRAYGITYDDFLLILDYQQYKCAICEQALKDGDRFLHVDHNHTTGKVRGLLCSQCNWFISKIDNIQDCFSNLKNYVKNDGSLWEKNINE